MTGLERWHEEVAKGLQREARKKRRLRQAEDRAWEFILVGVTLTVLVGWMLCRLR